MAKVSGEVSNIIDEIYGYSEETIIDYSKQQPTIPNSSSSTSIPKPKVSNKTKSFLDSILSKSKANASPKMEK